MDVKNDNEINMVKSRIDGELELPLIEKKNIKSTICRNSIKFESLGKNKEMVIMFNAVIENDMKDSDKYGKKIFQI